EGWSAKADAAPVDVVLDRPSESWLRARTTDGRELDVVRWSPGEVRLGFVDVRDVRGDPASFAISWARLFDAAWSPAGITDVEERRAAGEGAVHLAQSAGDEPQHTKN